MRAQYQTITETRVVHEAVRRLIGDMVEDIVAETHRRVAAAKPASAADIRRLGHPVVAFSKVMSEKERALKNFLFERMYRHAAVVEETDRARGVVSTLFNYLIEEPDLLPDQWRREAGRPNTAQTARVVCDYVAGMTDQFAQRLHRRILEGKH